MNVIFTLCLEPNLWIYVIYEWMFNLWKVTPLIDSRVIAKHLLCYAQL